MVNYESEDEQGDRSSSNDDDDDVVVREIANVVAMERMIDSDNDDDDDQFEMYQVEQEEEDDEEENEEKDDEDDCEEEIEKENEEEAISEESMSECEIEVVGSLDSSAIERIKAATSQARPRFKKVEENAFEEETLIEFVKFDKDLVAFLSGGYRQLTGNGPWERNVAQAAHKSKKRTRSLPLVRPDFVRFSSLQKLSDTITIVSGVLDKKTRNMEDLGELVGGDERIVRVRSDDGSSAHVTVASFASWIKTSEAQGFHVDDSVVGSRAGLLVEETFGLSWQRTTGLKPHPNCQGDLRMVWAPPGGYCSDDDDDACGDAVATYLILKGHLVASTFVRERQQQQFPLEHQQQRLKRTVDFDVAEGDCVYVPKGWGAVQFRHAQKKNDECVLWIKKRWQGTTCP